MLLKKIFRLFILLLIPAISFTQNKTDTITYWDSKELKKIDTIIWLHDTSLIYNLDTINKYQKQFIHNFVIDTTFPKLPKPKLPFFTLKPHKAAFINRNDMLIYLIEFGTGWVEGIRDYAYYHPNQFLAAHPKFNPRWWDPRISWQAKYHNNWVVRTFFVWVTDFNHAAKALEHLGHSLTIYLSFNDLKNWKKIAAKTIIAYAVNRIGFNSSYR